jgi:hypothetical protein
MTDTTGSPSPDELTERIGKLNEHIDAFQVEVDLWQGDRKSDFASVVAELRDDRDAAAAAMRKIGAAAGEEWQKVTVQASRAFQRLESELEAVRADFAAEVAEDADAFKVATQRQLDSWRGHVEQLRLQAKLAEMDARDALADLERAYEAALPHLEQAKESADESVKALRERGRGVTDELRSAARAASRKME